MKPVPLIPDLEESYEELSLKYLIWREVKKKKKFS